MVFDYGEAHSKSQGEEATSTFRAIEKSIKLNILNSGRFQSIPEPFLPCWGDHNYSEIFYRRHKFAYCIPMKQFP